MLDLKKMREKLKEQENRKTSFSTDNALYKLWEIPYEERAVIRFLPDSDENNPFFWVKREMIKLPFYGTLENMNEEVIITVPCIEMYYEHENTKHSVRCPIMQELRKMFRTNDPDIEAKARQYWKKVSYIFQGFVVKSPIDEEEPPENPIRRFIINKQLFSVIKGGLMDPEIEENPVDYERGRDFFVTKTRQGEYATYVQSKWSIKERPLSDEELEAIETYGLWNLKEFLPTKPTEEELRDYYEMFEASIMGKPFDETKWGKYRFNVSSTNSSEILSKKPQSKDEFAFHSKKEIIETIEEEMEDKKSSKATRVDIGKIIETDNEEDDEEEVKSKKVAGKTKTDPREIIARIKERKTKS